MTKSDHQNSPSAGSAHKRRWLLPLIFIPFLPVLYVPFFNRLDPTLAGIPFYYWFQMLWIPISAAITYVVYLATNKA
jgi:hypothetical protein